MVNVPIFPMGSRHHATCPKKRWHLTHHDRLQSFSDPIFLLGTGGQHVTSKAKEAFFFLQEHRLNGEGEGDSTMGTQKPSFLGVISPIFLGPKTSKTFIFHGFGVQW